MRVASLNGGNLESSAVSSKLIGGVPSPSAVHPQARDLVWV